MSMAEIVPDSSLTDTDNSTKLHSLFDAALDQQREETSQFVSRWEELKRDQGLRLAASSFVVCEANVEDYVQISVACDSPRDFVMWKLCFVTAIAKLNNPDASIETHLHKIYAIMDPVEAVNTLELMEPLFHRTDFEKREIDPAINVPALNPHAETADKLQQLIDSVLEHQRHEYQQLFSHYEQLKVNPSQNLVIIAFYLSSRTVHHCQCVSNGIQLTAISLSPNDILLWRSYLMAVLNKVNISESSIETVRNDTNFKVTLNAEAMIRVFYYLNPLANRIICEDVTIRIPSDILQNLSNFFETMGVRCLKLAPEDTENVKFELWLDFVRKANPTWVISDRASLSNEIHHFLLPLAEIVEKIFIGISLPISVIREIFRRKCNTFYIHGEITPLSLAEAEDLVEFFHRLEKKTTLGLITESALMNIQVGVYKVRTRPDPIWPGRHAITIKGISPR